MNRNTLANMTGGLFLVIGVLHFVRFAFRWEASVAGQGIPVWVSLFIALLAWYLAYESFRKRAAWYVCTGTCGGISAKPGVCEAEKCPKVGKSLEEVRM